MANADNNENKRGRHDRDRDRDRELDHVEQCQSSSLSSVPSKGYKERLSIYSAKMVDFDNKNNSSNNSRTSASGVTAKCTSDTENELVQLLALQSYHLPGNNLIQDWAQFMVNNHPVFGICFFWNIHPIKSCTRVVALIGTIAFGLALANLFYVFFLWNPELNIVLAKTTTDDGKERILVTTGMLLLWTVGGGIHCMFNLAVWHIAACACCQNGGCCEKYAYCPNLGSKMMRIFVSFTVLLCILIVLLRVAINDKEQQQQYQEEYEYDEDNNNRGIDILIDDELNLSVESISEFTFVLSYLVEMILSLFVYYPIGVVILFSGILACGFKIPVLGGRPYEIACEERRHAKHSRKSTTTTKRSDGVDLDLDVDIEQNTNKT